VAQNSSFFTHLIPAGFWQELRHLGLLPPDAPVPSGS